MAYTINSAKDVASDEQAFVDRFNQNLNAIVAYQRANGGDLEGAYQKITGEAWPAGRSVEMDNGRGVMTKDRTVKSVLGKYVLPIAAGVVTGGAALGAFGGGAAAAGAGASAGGAGASAGGAGAAGVIPGTTIAGGAGQVPVWAGGAAAAAGSGAGYFPGTTIAEGAGQVPRPPSGPGALDMLKNTVPGAANRLIESGEGLSPILRAAIGALAGIGPALMAGRGNEPSAEEKALMVQAQRMQALQEQRITAQNPLFNAVNQLAMGRLPTAVQRPYTPVE